MLCNYVLLNFNLFTYSIIFLAFLFDCFCLVRVILGGTSNRFENMQLREFVKLFGCEIEFGKHFRQQWHDGLLVVGIIRVKLGNDIDEQLMFLIES